MQKTTSLATPVKLAPQPARTRPFLVRCSIILCTIALLLSACGGPIDTPQSPTSQTTQPIGTSAPASPKAASKAVHSQVQQDPAGVLKYWTKDKMSKAI